MIALHLCDPENLFQFAQIFIHRILFPGFRQQIDRLDDPMLAVEPVTFPPDGFGISAVADDILRHIAAHGLQVDQRRFDHALPARDLLPHKHMGETFQNESAVPALIQIGL